MSTQISEITAAIVAPRGRPWPKGVSGNPGGRPKAVADLRAAARMHTADAIGVLVEVMGDTNASPSARITAARELLDRGWGKAPAAIALCAERPDADQEEQDRLERELQEAIEDARNMMG
jgi:hypothetical protein